MTAAQPRQRLTTPYTVESAIEHARHHVDGGPCDPAAVIVLIHALVDLDREKFDDGIIVGVVERSLAYLGVGPYEIVREMTRKDTGR
jgi:hypothetical protein